jgi:hypothetical protein
MPYARIAFQKSPKQSRSHIKVHIRVEADLTSRNTHHRSSLSSFCLPQHQTRASLSHLPHPHASSALLARVVFVSGFQRQQLQLPPEPS